MTPGAWDSLPHDIRLLLLRTFCIEIIKDFRSLRKSVWLTADKSYFDTELESTSPPLAWPPTPAPLKSFMSALTSCRELNYIILHEVKFKGVSPIDILKAAQERSVDALIRKYKAKNSSGLVSVALYGLAAGTFWKNRKLIWYPLDILRRTTTRSAPLYLPHIEPWLKYHFPQPRSSRPPNDVALYYLVGNREYACFFEMNWCAKRRNEIGTVVSLRLGGLVKSLSLAEQDVGQSPAEQWWLFLPLSYGPQVRRHQHWIFVNYEEQRMYVGPNASEALVWKGRDVCDMGAWARLTTMDEIRDHGR
jgi:hypothetical protein